MNENGLDSEKMHFVLVHGASHGGWCWYKLQHLLHKAGHQVTAIDLAGAGIHRADPNTILSFDDYNRPLIHFLSSLPDTHKVVLVGHSAGGLSLTHASRLLGNKISVAVYIAATMLLAGFSSEQDVEDGFPKMVEQSEFTYGLGPDKPPTTVMFRKEVRNDLLYHLCPPEDATLASLLLRPAPCLALRSAKFDIIGGAEKEESGARKGGRVGRVYVKTLQDRILKAEQQEAMISRWPPDRVMWLNSDHCPFFSAPVDLHRLLLDVASCYL